MKYTTKQHRIISDNMIKYGGSFMKAIGEALSRADLENTEKLENAFPEEFEKYLGFSDESKTIKEWLETLEEPYRTQALNNLDSDTEDDIVLNLYTALSCAFVWESTLEGHGYWAKLSYTNYEHND